MLRPAVLVFGLLTGGCASTVATPQPFPVPANTPAASVPDPGAAADPLAPPPIPRLAGYGVAGTALALRGTPYLNGGSSPDSGFDCSGLVQYVFAKHAVALPRNVSEQYRASHPISGGTLEPGDLVFFATAASGPSHVGIAIGGDEFVHAPSSSGHVRVERLSAAYWASRFLGARRVQAAHP
jgi:cell wall-associated NlpC family hydrolase